mmetsp:Transcript_515/g.1533  ORF Transcript_515/g.1533 Transcript_515/m.1533 type:complete len:753 (+) Transcript_515:82-2340(+)
MALLRVLLFFIVATAGSAFAGRPTKEEHEAKKEEEAAEKRAAAAREAKMAAVNKVVSLLEDLRKKVTEEGEEEAQGYNKFACFCKDTMKDKSEAIEKGEDAKETLTTDIEKLSESRKELDEKIEKLVEEIEDEEKKVKEAKEERAKEKKEYEENEADLAGAISAVEAAYQALKAGKKPTLLQLQGMAKTLATAAVMADALGVGGESARSAASYFLQDVPTEDYEFHSDEIIETLEGLEKDFRKKKDEIDREEVDAKSKHDKLVQGKLAKIDRKTEEMNDKKKEKAEKEEAIAKNSQDLTTTAATLLDDQEYLDELAQMCSDRAKTWDQRSKMRADEISALTGAIGILEDKVKEKTSAATVRLAQRATRVRRAEAVARSQKAMEAVEAAAEAVEAGDAAAAPPPLAFLQRARRHQPAKAGDGRQAVINLLRSKGALLHSAALTSLASQLTADPFAKVKELLEELIIRLKKQAGNEATQKSFCDKNIGTAEKKRGNAAKDIKGLNADLAENEELRDELNEEIDEAEAKIKKLNATKEKAEKMRKDEKEVNEETVKEAEAGLEATEEAIKLLDRFYKKAAKAGNEEEKEEDSLMQRGPADEAPDTAFGAGEEYTGSQGGAGGVLGMLDVIKSDFERTISETEKSEAEAARDHKLFLKETGKSVAEKETAIKEKKKQRDDAEESIEEDGKDLKSKVEVLEEQIKELLKLKEVCDTGMSYEERVARREEEMEALRKALCILSNYAEYGPDGAENTSC